MATILKQYMSDLNEVIPIKTIKQMTKLFLPLIFNCSVPKVTTACWLRSQKHHLIPRVRSARSGTIAQRVPLIKCPAQQAHIWTSLNKMQKQIAKTAHLGSIARELGVSCLQATVQKDIIAQGDRTQPRLRVTSECC